MRVALALATVIAGLAGQAWSGPLSSAILNGTKLDGPVPASDFMPGPEAKAAKFRVSGRLTVIPKAQPDGFRVITDTAPPARDTRRVWPRLAVDLVTDGERLIPVQHGPIAAGNPDWDWIVEPGLAWSEPADGDRVRAVLPVALEERNANCIHNGRLLVILGPDGTASKAAIQFDTDTCLYFRFDAWGLAAASYAPGQVKAAPALVNRDRAERAARLPAKPISDLAATFPGIDLAALARAAGPGAVWGVVASGTHFTAPCPTRSGDDPLCAERDLPSYSTAKSLVAAQALFRLEALRPGVIHETIAAHVPACAAAGGWGDVRLIDMLDMASGHYVSAAPEADEAAPATEAFFDAETAAQKIAFTCATPRKAAPGGTFVYHTADTFLLGVAMTDALRKAGLGRDLYDDLIRQIWASIGQSAALDTTRRTYDSAAQPFTGWGLVYHRDDIVRAAGFLGGGGRIAGQPYLDPKLLGEALQRTEPGGGLFGPAPYLRYRHGFWARDVGPLAGCDHPVWAPFLSGYGGISVVLFPNGVQFYAFNDVNHFDWAASVPEVSKIRSLCG
ncbi:serine hydrolase [Phenylobacterium montanum]|uniref:Serine hydrolase n=1 Tax=Phenylobacterium montanum TaxID=2823693 RepID=A0A975FVA9_9CAUL|nr:serine hydrolase [Caulobacter sp. S6]QUD85954.1 serine hydrolase [Caulobacter sp. S6]